ncbi:seipin [Daktulosphaira vitifoliae]|uniref:seipin n=1 Tax=Daktulosphaira vitifoliae TaxID=58002 RepID=UPI0021AA2D74|nr:seipin [Daktulosphaira vitifoliae]
MFGFGFITRYLDRKKKAVNNKVRNITLRAMLAAYQGSIFWMSVVTVFWISLFLYVAFYTAYMPSLVYTRPVHMQYKPCYNDKGLCDYPSAHVRLPTKGSLMMVGQKYQMLIKLDLPESPVNERVGMFMVCARLADKHGQLISSSCRSARLRYVSTILRTVRTVLMAPLFLSGIAEEKQFMELEMYTEFVEDQLHPITDVHFEVLNHDVQIYSASMTVLARLSGLRYLMFHWPILSACVGIGTNLLFAIAVFALSWRHLCGSEVCANEKNDSITFGLMGRQDSSLDDSLEESSNSSDNGSIEDNSMKIKNSGFTVSDIMIAEQ